MSSNPAFPLQFRRPINEQIQWFADKFPTQRNREVQMDIREDFHHEVSVHFLHACLLRLRTRSVLIGNFAGEEDEMSDEIVSRTRYGEAFWRTHHEAWRRSKLNQREYCEAQGISLKAFGNWRARFKAEPQAPARKLLYRRGGLCHSLSHSPSHRLSHVTYGPPASELFIPPAREGHRRRVSEADKRQILEEAVQPGARLSEAARRYGIAARVLFRWQPELTPVAAPLFVTVQITDATGPSDAAPSAAEPAS